MKAFKIATLILATIALAQTAVADKLCLQSTVNKKTFKVTNKSVVAAKCPKGYTELADTSAFQGPSGAQGPAGATGPQGSSGGFNPNLCTKRETYKIGTGVVYNSAICEPSEILVASGCWSSAINNLHYVREWQLYPTEGSNYPELYSAVACRIEAIEGTQIVTAQAVCCKPS